MRLWGGSASGDIRTWPARVRCAGVAGVVPAAVCRHTGQAIGPQAIRQGGSPVSFGIAQATANGTSRVTALLRQRLEQFQRQRIALTGNDRDRFEPDETSVFLLASVVVIGGLVIAAMVVWRTLGSNES